jgi:hypothetical protein
MRLALTAFALGAAAFGALALVGALVLAVLFGASGRGSAELSVGAVELLAFERGGRSTSTTFGPGLVLLPLLGGCANALGAVALARRRRSD